MERLIKRHSGSGQLLVEKEAVSVMYQIDEFRKFVPDGRGGEVPTLKSFRGRISHAGGNPSFHPLLSFQPGPFPLVLEDGRKLNVICESERGSIVGTGDFF